MTAAYRLKGFGWFAGCTAIVLGFYLVSLQVASERKKLEHLDADIASTQRDIRALETEFDTRSNLAQLERWNGDTLALSAPVPGQFLHDAAELASVDVIRSVGASSVRTAALIVPSFAALAVPQSVQAAPAASVSVPSPRVAVALAAFKGVRAHGQTLLQPKRPTSPFEAVQRPERLAIAAQTARTPVTRPAITRVSFDTIDDPSVHRVTAHAHPQIALLDRKLLSDSTLRDLVGGARTEGVKLR